MNATIDHGPILNVSLESDEIPVDGSIVVLVNATDVFVYEYCGVPGALLMRDGNAYRYVFPIEARCMEPENATIDDRIAVELDAIRTASGSMIDPGEYEFKVFYATVAPGVGVREANLFFTITAGR